MSWSYDGEVDALYISYSSALSVRQRQLGDGTAVDFAEDGTVVGVEILRTFRWKSGALRESGLLSDAEIDHLVAVLAAVTTVASTPAVFSRVDQGRPNSVEPPHLVPHSPESQQLDLVAARR